MISCSLLQQARARLKLLDSALTLECGPKYNGPLLPKDFSAKSVNVDGRIPRFAAVVENSLKALFKNSKCVTESIARVPNMPLNELYIIDLFLHKMPIPPPTSTEQEVDVLEMSLQRPSEVLRQRFNPRYDDVVVASKMATSKASGRGSRSKEEEAELIAVLIHLPEHFCSGGRDLIGPQMMRVRHLRLLGCSVMSLSLEKLAELRSQPQALLDYLQESLSPPKV